MADELEQQVPDAPLLLPEVREELVVPHDPDEVWAALTASGRDTWLGPEVELPATPGGQGWVVDDEGRLRRLHLHDATPGRRLAWEWWTEPDGAATRVEVQLEPVDGGTRVTVVEATPFPPAPTPPLMTGPHRAAGARRGPQASARRAAPAALTVTTPASWFLPDPAPPFAWARAIRRLVGLPALVAASR